MVATVRFFSAGGPASGVEISGNRIIAAYASSGFGDLVIPGAAQDITWITTSGGIAIGGGLVQSGQMNNNKWTDASGVSVNSGVRQNLSQIVDSGLATIRIQVTDTGNINISGAKLYAYDTNDVNNNPSGIWVLSYEIIPVGYSGTGDTQWAVIDSTDYNYMVDRTPDVGWAASGEFNYYIGLSIRPTLTTTSGFQNFGLFFDFDYS